MLTVLTLPSAPRQAGWKIERAKSRIAGPKLSDLPRLVAYLGVNHTLHTHSVPAGNLALRALTSPELKFYPEPPNKFLFNPYIPLKRTAISRCSNGDR